MSNQNSAIKAFANSQTAKIAELAQQLAEREAQILSLQLAIKSKDEALRKISKLWGRIMTDENQNEFVCYPSSLNLHAISTKALTRGVDDVELL